MERYEFTRKADADLNSVIAYTVEHFGRAQARRAAERVFEAAERLAAMPESGHCRDDLTEDTVLFWTISKLGITLVYDPKATPLLILHIVGPGQDTSGLFRG